MRFLACARGVERRGMEKSKIVLVTFFIATIVGAFVISWLIVERPRKPEIEEVITGDQWTPSVWRAEGEAYVKNGALMAFVEHISDLGLYGNANFQQGNTPHSLWDNPAKLKKEATICRDQSDEVLILHFVAKRTTITWLVQNEDRFCNIGVTLFGDVGLDYDSPDTTQPRALIIDFYLSMHPKEIDETHRLGSDVERDYHSGFKVERMEEINREYEFVVRIDGMIRTALKKWKNSP